MSETKERLLERLAVIQRERNAFAVMVTMARAEVESVKRDRLDWKERALIAELGVPCDCACHADVCEGCARRHGGVR